MSNKSVGLTDELHAYLLNHGSPEPSILKRLRSETAEMPNAQMQIAPEQGQFMAFLAQALGVTKYLEVGTFTGYSSLAMALAMPPNGRLTCCDVSDEWTRVASRFWAEAGVADRVDLRLGPAMETLRHLIDAGLSDTYDFAFVDADKENYPGYYELCLKLVRPGGIVAVDNVFGGGEIADLSRTDSRLDAIRATNDLIAGDPRVTASIIPIADGLTLARKN